MLRADGDPGTNLVYNMFVSNEAFVKPQDSQRQVGFEPVNLIVILDLNFVDCGKRGD